MQYAPNSAQMDILEVMTRVRRYLHYCKSRDVYFLRDNRRSFSVFHHGNFVCILI